MRSPVLMHHYRLPEATERDYALSDYSQTLHELNRRHWSMLFEAGSLNRNLERMQTAP